MVVTQLSSPLQMPNFSSVRSAAGAPAGPSESFAPGEPAARPTNVEKAALMRLFQEPGALSPQTGGSRQMADYDGRVKHLALMLSSYARQGEMREQVLGAYKTLFNKMEPDTKFSIIVESERDKADVQRAIEESGCPNPERIQLIQPGVGDLTVWARDMMVGLDFPGSPDRTMLMAQKPLHDWHGNDRDVPIYLSHAAPGVHLNMAKRLCTDGGDTTSNKTDSFVGHYSIAATAERLEAAFKDDDIKNAGTHYFEAATGKHVVASGGLPYTIEQRDTEGLHRMPLQLVEKPGFAPVELRNGQASEAEMYEWLSARMFEREFGKPVTVLGADDPNTPDHTEEPATDHMDMGFTPFGDKEAFLGDPGLAKQLLEGMTPAEIKQANERLSEIAGKPVTIENYFSGVGTRNRDNQEDFESYKRIAEGKGLEVTRLPHLEPQDGMPYISYNNCLMERFQKDGQEVKRVFLPQYGVPKLDDYARGTWESKGFEVIPMELGALSAYWGALRCISNWLERSPNA